MNYEKGTKLLRLGQAGLKFKIENVSYLNGYRIINLDSLKEHVVEITLHTVTCTKAHALAESGRPPVSLTSESNRSGLFSILWAKCHGCEKKFPLKTSPSIKTDDKIFDINVRAVWGAMTSGGGAASLNEVLGTLNMPTISERFFTSLEHKIGDWWQQIFEEDIKLAGAEEKRLAIERGDYFEDVPAITVVTDGAWSKRSHKHTYNALGGVGVIFGLESKKLLYIGVRNKYCSICHSVENIENIPEHRCYKNWDLTSQSMETDIITEGFLKAETMQGLRYMRLIADGDSSECTHKFKKKYQFGVPM